MNKYVTISVALALLLAVAVQQGTQEPEFQGEPDMVQSAAVPTNDREQWSLEFLEGVGNAAPTWETMQFVVAWQGGENTAARFNPLATTQTMSPEPPDPCFNYLSGKCGVKNYVDRRQGLDASIITVSNGYYPNILYGLQTNQPELALNASELGTWGTGLGNVETEYRKLVASPPVQPAAGDSDIRTKLVQTAMTQIGKPYLLGAAPMQGPDPANFDCSSFVQWVYWMNGIQISRTTFSQLAEGFKVIESQELLPGDLIYQQWPSDQHVLMWAGDVDGDGLGDVVNAGGYRNDVNVISNFFGDAEMVGHIIGFRRVL